MARRPLVLAHRGASAVAPENTIAAFSKARELGADGVELDVRRSADGVLIVHHDPAIEGVGPLVQLTFAQLRAARPAVPTFDEALDACRGMVVNAEVKCLPWETDADGDGSVMRATVDALAGREGTFIVSSFDLRSVDLARDVRARRRDRVVDPRPGARRRGADRVRPRSSMAESRRGRRAGRGAGGDQRRARSRCAREHVDGRRPGSRGRARSCRCRHHHLERSRPHSSGDRRGITIVIASGTSPKRNSFVSPASSPST